MNFLPLSTTMGLSEALGLSGFGFGIVLIVLAFLAVFVLILSSFFKKNKTESAKAPTKQETVAEVIPETPVVTETKTQDSVYTGYVTLEGISEQDAAVVMAITSHNTGIPLERLGFCSIKLKSPELINVTEQDAATVMAITSHKTGIPLENLYFKSIRLMED